MDAIKKMIPFQLPPAGNRVIWKRTPDYLETLGEVFLPYDIKFYGSGASALAAAIILFNNKKKLPSPQVLLPAYSCPELVSAIRFAKATPVFVDFAENSTFLDIQQLESKINANTLAVIAVDLFGLRERLEILSRIAKKYKIFLIEDSAQYFPQKITKESWSGDAVILSFGRGKPVSVLDNGAALFRAKIAESESAHDRRINTRQILKTRLKISIYNLLLNPYLYWVPVRLPFLSIGATKYRRMTKIVETNEAALSLLPRNIEYIQNRAKLSDLLIAIKERIASISEEFVFDLPGKYCDDARCQLTRYPIVIQDCALVERIKNNTELKKYGITFMYEKTLPEIPGVIANKDVKKDFPNARKIASGLLTVPIHERVKKRDIDAIFDIIESEYAQANHR